MLRSYRPFHKCAVDAAAPATRVVSVLARRATGTLTAAPAIPARPIAQQAFQDEREALWGPTRANPADINQAVTFWLRCGLDPSLHLPRAREVRHADDDAGTDINSPDKAHADQSRAFWMHHFTQMHLNACRLERSRAAGLVGIVRDSTPGSALPQDEADRPDTAWEKDTLFVPLLRLAKSTLGEHVSNREDVERAIRTCSPESFFLFCEALLERPTSIEHAIHPLPSPAFVYYHNRSPAVGAGDEGKLREEWCVKYQAARLLADAETLSELEKLQRGGLPWSTVAANVADQLLRVYTIVSEGLGKHTAVAHANWLSLPDATRDYYAATLTRWSHNCLLEGSWKPLPLSELTLTTDAKQAEEVDIAIHALLTSPLGVAPGLTLQRIWRDTFRLDALETLQYLQEPHFVDLSCASYRRILDEAAVQDASLTLPALFLKVSQQLVDSVRHSTYDSRNGCVIPSLNDTWCKANWYRFGSGDKVQIHQLAASSSSAVDGSTGNTSRATPRRLTYSYATLPTVRALAAYYYRTRPLSQNVDYSSPFRYRQSIVDSSANAAVECLAAQQATAASAIRAVQAAEDAMTPVVASEKWRFGQHRRQLGAARRRDLRLGQPFAISNVALEELTPEEPAGLRGGWALGTARRVSFTWGHRGSDALSAQGATPSTSREAPPSTSRHVAEVSLWREKAVTPPAADVKVPLPSRAAMSPWLQAAPELERRVDALRYVRQWTNSQLSRLVGACNSAGGAPEGASAQELTREFVAILKDSISVGDARSFTLRLPALAPAVGGPLSDTASDGRPVLAATGERFQLRVRIYDHSINPKHRDDGLYVEAYSPSFAAVDALDATVLEYTKSVTGGGESLYLPGAAYIGLCQHLRDVGYAVSLDTEFEGGQCLTPKGEVVLSNLAQLVRKQSAHSDTAFFANLTRAQLDAEPLILEHWLLHNPGATVDEWHATRRWVLEDAFAAERFWWTDDRSVVSDPQGLRFEAMDTMARYVRDLTGVLSARGSCDWKPVTPGHSATPQLVPATGVSCEVSGFGSVPSLRFDANTVDEQRWTLDDVITGAKTAIEDGHTRLNTLHEVRFKEFNRALFLQATRLAGQSSRSGRFAGTEQLAWSKAASETQSLTGSLVARSEALLFAREKLAAPAARVSDGGEEADRYPSQDDPALRRRYINPTPTIGGEDWEALPPEAKSTWGT